LDIAGTGGCRGAEALPRRSYCSSSQQQQQQQHFLPAPPELGEGVGIANTIVGAFQFELVVGRVDLRSAPVTFELPPAVIFAASIVVRINPRETK